jgi:SAM-dependent methyltransferase
MDLRAALSVPAIYRAFVRAVVGDYRYVVELAQIRAGQRVLDLGCGPADVAEFMPEGVDYVGIDISEEYIAAARARFGDRHRFVCAPLRDVDAVERAAYDVVLGHGVLHHVDDAEAAHALGLARQALRPRGYVVTIDPCFVDSQSRMSRWLVGKDRGEFVRTPEAYEALGRRSFATVAGQVRHDLLRIPYSHFVMRCAA